ncbi:MAG TPA: hypothetical protein VK400_18510 [Pyrinomonadaceae bacterium]|nr:hypothetical protein [Pyrinomonadaceae bacterium]
MESTFVCNMNALNAVERERYKQLIERLNENRQSIKELNDGYAFRYKADTRLIQEVAEFIAYERLCCPFFDFELAVEQDTNRLWLRLRGQDGVKEFIRDEFGIEEG